MENCVTYPLKKSIGEYTSIRISVEYCKGRMVGISDIIKGRGIYVFVRPIKKTKYPVDYALFGTEKELGMRVYIKKLNRNNKKMISEIFEKINQKETIAKIVDLYENERYSEIEDIIFSKTGCNRVVEEFNDDFVLEF